MDQKICFVHFSPAPVTMAVHMNTKHIHGISLWNSLVDCKVRLIVLTGNPLSLDINASRFESSGSVFQYSNSTQTWYTGCPGEPDKWSPIAADELPDSWSRECI